MADNESPHPIISGTTSDTTRDPIAFTSRTHQVLVINDGHMTSAIPDQTFFLQISRYSRYGRPLCADHLCQILLRKVQYPRPDSILRRQGPTQPATWLTLLDCCCVYSRTPRRISSVDRKAARTAGMGIFSAIAFNWIKQLVGTGEFSSR